MDSADISKLLHSDTKYLQPESAAEEIVGSIDIADGTASMAWASLAELSLEERLAVSPDTQESTKVFFIRQKRHYKMHRSKNHIYLGYHTWEDVLDRLAVLPSFLELLDNNNGGYSSHVSYCADQCAEEHSPSSGVIDSVSAFHLCIKIGDWGNYEYAVYARHNFHTGHNLILIIGTNSEDHARRLMSRLVTGIQVNMFQVLFYLASLWVDQLEKVRWQMDYATQDLEARTGFASLQGFEVDPLPAEQLAFGRGLHVTADYLNNVAYGSERIGEAILFLQDQLLKFAALRSEDGHGQRLWRRTSQLQSALMQKHSLARCQFHQINRLCARVAAQQDVTKTLIAQRDTQINIEISKAAKRDSELMKGITVVTMVFLPATFMATFFSMVFWHVGTETEVQLLVDRWIWLYPAVTLPLTVLILTWYWAFPWNRGQILQNNLPSSVFKKLLTLSNWSRDRKRDR
ncbi:hypothetical protein MMC11_005424 [Xylographa trunciseda]|nr:hypothetical protein [Xylographa trunciseda]